MTFSSRMNRLRCTLYSTIKQRPPIPSHVVSVRLTEEGGFDVMKEIPGDTISDVLSFVEYNPQDLFEKVRTAAEKAVRDGRLSVAERQKVVESYAAGLRGYTYYER